MSFRLKATPGSTEERVFNEEILERWEEANAGYRHANSFLQGHWSGFVSDKLQMENCVEFSSFE